MKAISIEQIREQIKTEIIKIDKIYNKTNSDLIKEKAIRVKNNLLAIDPEKEYLSRIERAQFFTLKTIEIK